MVLPVIKQPILHFAAILNLEWHLNRIAGSKVMAFLLIGWILSVGGASSGGICAQLAKQACFINQIYTFFCYLLKCLFVPLVYTTILLYGVLQSYYNEEKIIIKIN